MNVKDYEGELGFLYARLGDGQTEAGALCPSCKGGSSKERTLSVTRRGSLLLYKCHRASCTFNGGFRIGRTPGAGEREYRPRKSYPCVRTDPIDSELAEFLSTKYAIPREVVESSHLTVVSEGDQRFRGRLCFPLYGPDFKERGRVYRALEVGRQPKTITELKTADEVSMGWYRWKRRSDTLVLVEDCTSAIKLAPYVHSAALCGTNLSEGKVAEIKAQGYKHVYICLDNDATLAAIKLQLRWRHHIPGLLVHGLERDVKDMTTKELSKFLADLRGVDEYVTEQLVRNEHRESIAVGDDADSNEHYAG